MGPRCALLGRRRSSSLHRRFPACRRIHRCRLGIFGGTTRVSAAQISRPAPQSSGEFTYLDLARSTSARFGCDRVERQPVPRTYLRGLVQMERPPPQLKRSSNRGNRSLRARLVVDDRWEVVGARYVPFLLGLGGLIQDLLPQAGRSDTFTTRKAGVYLMGPAGVLMTSARFC
jgi:hypothetical protein